MKTSRERRMDEVVETLYDDQVSRYFIAIAPQELANDPNLKSLCIKLKRTLADRGRETRWLDSSLWHITVLYFGELSQSGKDRLLAAMSSRAVLNEFDSYGRRLILRMQGLGAFPSEDSARVLWIGVRENEALLSLREHLAALLAEKDIQLSSEEYGRFRPHLTLARFRNAHSVRDLIQLGGRKHFGDYPVAELIVFESVIQNNMPKYIPHLRISLGGPIKE